MTSSIANAANRSRRGLAVSLRRVLVIEWLGLILGAVALVLAMMIGAILALIVEGNAASMEIRDERSFHDDGKQDASGAGNKARPQAGRR